MALFSVCAGGLEIPFLRRILCMALFSVVCCEFQAGGRAPGSVVRVGGCPSGMGWSVRRVAAGPGAGVGSCSATPVGGAVEDEELESSFR